MHKNGKIEEELAILAYFISFIEKDGKMKQKGCFEESKMLAKL